MALIEGKVYSKNNSMLTLTNEQYWEYEKVNDFMTYIIGNSMIIHVFDHSVAWEKTPGLLSVTFENQVLRIFSKDRVVTAEANNKFVNVTIDKLKVVDPSNLVHEFYSPNPVLDRIVPYTDDICFQRTTRILFRHIKQNDTIGYLFTSGKFFASTLRNNSGEFLVTEKKIVKFEPFHDHLMVKYEGDDEAYLILLCYASFYEVPLNMSFPGDNIKSARGYAEPQTA